MAEGPNVPLLDLKPQYLALKAEIDAAIQAVVDSQYFILGPTVSDFEGDCRDYCEVPHALGCASGSDALLLALMALLPGVPRIKGQVICPSYTFFATGGAISRIGLTPVFADIDPVTYNMCPEHTAALAEECDNLLAIMPVHLYGQACDIDAMLEIGERHGVPVIEDAAQALGTRDAHGTMVGSRGTVGTWSFFPSKNLGGFGDGGLCTTADPDIAERIRILRVHGMEPKYYHQEVGINSRLDALQAAVLKVKLKHLEEWHAGRIDNASFYDAAFAEAGASTSMTPLSEGGFPLRTPHANPAPARHIYNQYVIRVPGELRDELRAHLSEQGIGSEIYYPVPLHMQDCFADLGHAPEDLPESLRAARETIALPIYPDLTDEQRSHVANTVVSFMNQHAACMQQ